jgi:hypothetical protein
VRGYLWRIFHQLFLPLPTQASPITSPSSLAPRKTLLTIHNSQNYQIPTISVGPTVKTGQYSEKINHYNVLRTLEDMYKLLYAYNDTNVAPISDCWH